MGVKGLWRLLLPIGRRISIETLAGKTLAIDASIWLTQFLKAMRDPETGKLVRSAHLVGFFRRICRLRFHRIRPIFVFDGATPEIKRAEVLRRKRKRDTFAASLDQSAMQRLAKKILTDKLRKVKVQKAGNTTVTTAETVNNEQKSGLEPGFNPGCQGRCHNGTEGAQDVKVIDDLQDSKPAAIESEFIDLINEDSAASVGNKVSDWDLPLATETSLEPVEPNDPHEDSEKRFVSAFSIEDGSLAVDMVSSLSTELERKNAVELARKQQRMQSRREFMPAAANPQDFSSVQMRNFLKYCKLNRDIASMAKRVAEQRKNDTGLVGYSTTSRIELVQDEDNNQITLEDSDSSDDDGSGPVPLLQHKLSNLRSKRVQHSTVRSKKINNDDSDDGSLEESSNDCPTLKARQNRRIIFDSDDDDETETVLSKVGVRPSFIDDTGLESQLGTDVQLSGGFLPTRTDVMNVTARAFPVACTLLRTDAWGNEEASSDFKLARILQEEQDGLLAANIDEAAINCKTEVSKQEKHDWSEKICNNESAYSESDEVCTDDIDWEDGSAQGDEVSNSSLPAPLDKTNICFNEGRADGADVDVAITKSESPIVDAVGNDFKRIHQAQDTMDALKQAEATASNLADWAGRAFRKALKEADQIQPDSPAEAQNVLLEDNSSDMDSVSSSREEVDQAYEENPKISSHGALMNLKTKQDRSTKRISPQLLQGISTTLFDDINWKAIRSQHDKETDTISEEMLEESKFLLRLFGIPYVEAPAEAEAQCAAMEKMGLVDGVVTEDSDAFVFGAQKVYKHIFDEQKYAEAYVSRDAEKEMNLNQNSMVALAMLLGGDYTEGVKGVGIVNAMELLEAYDVSENLEGGLGEFKKWLDGFDPFVDGPTKSKDGTSVATRKKERFHEQHKSARTRWVAPINFPSKEVMKAYLEPVVDQSSDDFTWGTVDEDNLVKFCEAYMGWDADETRRLLQPVLDAQKPGLQQRRIDSYMRYEDSIKFGEIQSKRLQSVLRRKTQTSTSETSADSK